MVCAHSDSMPNGPKTSPIGPRVLWVQIKYDEHLCSDLRGCMYRVCGELRLAEGLYLLCAESSSLKLRLVAMYTMVLFIHMHTAGSFDAMYRRMFRFVRVLISFCFRSFVELDLFLCLSVFSRGPLRPLHVCGTLFYRYLPSILVCFFLLCCCLALWVCIYLLHVRIHFLSWVLFLVP